MDNFKNTLCFDPSKKHADIPPNYKPEINITDICNDAKKDQYWKCIGDMQWDVALFHIDIMYATIVISWYCTAMGKDHLTNTQYLYDYLNKYTSTYIEFNNKMPAYDNFNTIEGNWGNL